MFFYLAMYRKKAGIHFIASGSWSFSIMSGCESAILLPKGHLNYVNNNKRKKKQSLNSF